MSTRGRIIRTLVAAAVATPLAFVAGTVLTSPVEAADPVKPFTFVVLSDTQGYTLSDRFSPIMSQQTRWIRDHRKDLNTAFVAQVGDLVESHPSDPMWQRASTALKVLDDAGVPNSVLPGNHDMNVATGEAAKFDQYFPPSRYTRSTWTPSTATYGGYLGQNLFGPDPVNRQNKDNFSLFTAGGLDFLMLNLEYEAPDYAIAWAQKVIDNYPQRRVILATHGFVDTDNQRGSFTTRTDAGTNSAPKIWDKLVFNNCNIFMVVNGHWTSRKDGTQGEGRRADVNACGKPVNQVLSDYQGRPNGGDGWLRYYTFDPAKDTISARTYSPFLEKYETDADSQFTMTYSMSTPADDLDVIHSKAGSQWRYRFQSSAPASTWTANSYDAAAWKTGYGSLGFGSYSPVTNIDVPAGTTRPLAAQFRRVVTLKGAARLLKPKLTVFADDGVIVYVNGKEVGRSNLPAGAITHTTYATTARNHAAAVTTPLTFTIPSGLLKDGANTIAAQVNSNYKATSDLTFEATLSSTSR